MAHSGGAAQGASDSVGGGASHARAASRTSSTQLSAKGPSSASVGKWPSLAPAPCTAASSWSSAARFAGTAESPFSRTSSTSRAAPAAAAAGFRYSSFFTVACTYSVPPTSSESVSGNS